MANVAADLEAVGIRHIHELASTGAAELSTALQFQPEEAATLVGLGQALLLQLAGEQQPSKA